MRLTRALVKPAFASAARRTSLALAAGRAAAAASFHTTRPALVKAGDFLPDMDVLVEITPGNKVNLAREFAAKDGIIIGVPAAFSPGCSNSHVPSYMLHPKIKDVGQVFVVSVNDAFVMKAWSEQMDPAKQTGMWYIKQFRFLGDPTAAFTKSLELDFDGTAIFGGPRSKRYALIIQDGKVKSAHVEPDSTGTNVTMAEKVLG